MPHLLPAAAAAALRCRVYHMQLRARAFHRAACSGQKGKRTVCTRRPVGLRTVHRPTAHALQRIGDSRMGAAYGGAGIANARTAARQAGRGRAERLLPPDLRRRGRPRAGLGLAWLRSQHCSTLAGACRCAPPCARSQPLLCCAVLCCADRRRGAACGDRVADSALWADADTAVQEAAPAPHAQLRSRSL